MKEEILQNTVEDEKIETKIISKCFSHNSKCFCLGTNKGFSVFSSVGVKKLLERALDFEVKMIEILDMTNIFVMVEAKFKNESIFESNKVIVWDEKEGKVLVEISFNEQILNMKIRRDKLFVVTEYKIFVFDTVTFSDVVDEISTGENPYGAIAITYSDNSVVAYPDKTNGNIRIKNYSQENSEFSIEKVYDIKIAYMCFNEDGSLLVTASIEGILIRIYETETCKMIQEVTRGKDEARIKCICFDESETFMAVSSNKGTVHIFGLGTAIKNLKEMKEKEEIKRDFKILKSEEKSNTKSAFRFLPGFLGGNRFDHEWSFAQVRIKDPDPICAFSPEKIVIVVGSDGKHYLSKIDMQNGKETKMKTKEYKEYCKQTIDGKN